MGSWDPWKNGSEVQATEQDLESKKKKKCLAGVPRDMEEEGVWNKTFPSILENWSAKLCQQEGGRQNWWII